MSETVLIVDDEESVRRTFADWLRTSQLDIEVHVVGDAEEALLFANEHPIDLAILDWNLGTGSDGLQLLEDLVEFHPDVVAILITGFANQATPLDALRMGVRDYLDKNQNLTRETFLASVRKQLHRIRPAKQQRAFNDSLAQFRASVEEILPMVQASATLNDPVPLPDAIHGLLRFLCQVTGADDGVLVIRQLSVDEGDRIRVYNRQGDSLPVPAISFGRTIAASVASLQNVAVMNEADFADGAVERFPFEQGRTSILAAPMPVGGGTHAIIELFDKPTFTDADRQLVQAALPLGVDLLRRAYAEQQTNLLLFNAVEAALSASQAVTQSLDTDVVTTPPPTMMEQLKVGWDSDSPIPAETGVRLLEAIRELTQHHGDPAIQHCLSMVKSLRQTLDRVTGIDG